jgi:hypothetical protein
MWRGLLYPPDKRQVMKRFKSIKYMPLSNLSMGISASPENTVGMPMITPEKVEVPPK